ncbi:Fur family transcriptional regulator [Paraburkholderia flava]|uniref:Fur family transcriptional regulator n=1 Tax=Paraburkholderia flava TaxID=2547393 RepID=UPI00105B7638|nr:Fur family transcriptional regulator [Paraburkholderia flava]
MQDLYKLLDRAGLRPTSPRIKVLGFMHAHVHEHFGAEQVYRSLADGERNMSLSTVYRVLGQFVEAKLVSAVAIADGSFVYELNDGRRHYHMMCNACGCIEEFADAQIDARLQEIAAGLEFAVSEQRLMLFGLCAACRAPAKTDATTKTASPEKPALRRKSAAVSERESEQRDSLT